MDDNSATAKRSAVIHLAPEDKEPVEIRINQSGTEGAYIELNRPGTLASFIDFSKMDRYKSIRLVSQKGINADDINMEIKILSIFNPEHPSKARSPITCNTRAPEYLSSFRRLPAKAAFPTDNNLSGNVIFCNVRFLPLLIIMMVVTMLLAFVTGVMSLQKCFFAVLIFSMFLLVPVNAIIKN